MDDVIAANQSVTVSNFVNDKFHSLWNNIKKVINPKYEAVAPCADGYNVNDIEESEQYMAEIEKHRNSIITTGPLVMDYYWDGSQNKKMLRLDHNGDIEEEKEESPELELKYADLGDNNEQNLGSQYSQICNEYDLDDHHHQQQQSGVIEESEESDDSVQTTIISGGSKRNSVCSNSSQTALSVNSLSAQSQKTKQS